MTTPPNEANAAGQDADDVQRILAMPKELGVLLITAGVGGLLLPGPVGSPFLLLGCVILWPAAFSRAESCFEKRFPALHHHGMKQVRRFLSDLEKRYPSTP